MPAAHTLQSGTGGEHGPQQLSELVSRGQLLCASALLYFNPDERNPDPRSLTAVYHHLNTWDTLDTYVLQLGQPSQLLQLLARPAGLFPRGA